MGANETFLQSQFGAAPADPNEKFLRSFFGPPSTTAPTVRQAQDIGDSIIAGLQSSATGLAIRGKLPSMVLGEDAPWYHRLAAGAAGIITDLPLSVGGAAAGATVGTAVAPGIGTAVGGGAGAFAAPMAVREALIAAYNNGHAASWEGAWDIAKHALTGGAKGAVIGAATLGAGRFVSPLVAPIAGRAVLAGELSAGTARHVVDAAAFGTELSALTTTASALEGKMPTWQDFMDNAILLGGMKGAVQIAKGMRSVYAQTGRTPDMVLGDAMRDPRVKAGLTEEPLSHAEATKLAFNDTPTDISVGLKSGDGIVTFTPLQNTDSVSFSVKNAEGAVLGGGFKPSSRTGVWNADYFVNEEFRRQGALTAALDAFENATGQHVEKGATQEPTAVAFWADREANRKFSAIPEAYQAVTLDERIKAAIDANPKPEMIRDMLSQGTDTPAQLGADPTQDPVKYEYIADKDTAKGVLRAVTQMYQNEILAQTRGVVSNKQTAVDAMNAISDGVIDPHIVGEAGNAAEIFARAHLLKGAANHAAAELTKLADIPPQDLTPAMKISALASIERVAMLKSEMEGAGAEAGRALQILGAVKRDPSFLGDAKTLLKLAERKGALQDIAALASAFKDSSQMADFARRYTQATTIEKVLEAWKAAILTGPQTHLANIAGNIMKWSVEIPENIIAATITAGRQALSGDPLTMAQYKARAFSQIYGLQLGALDAVKIAAEVWRQQGAHVEKADIYRGAIEGQVGEAVRIPFKALQVEDVLFRTIAERAEAHIMAVDRVVEYGFNPNSIEGQAKVMEYTNRPEAGLDAEAGKAAIERVQNAGAEAVFSQRLGTRMATIQRAMQGHWSQFIIPFFRTPANLVSWAVQHVPGLNFLSARWRADYDAGGERQARAISRVMMGTALTLTAYTLAENGTLTGGGMFQKEENRAKSAAGWQPYSIKIGDKYYSYQRIEPVAKVLGLAADLHDMMKVTKDEGDKAKLASMTVLLFGNATISTTYLSGLANAVQSIADPTRYGENFMEQYASSLVPKIVGQTVTALDPYKREVSGTIEAIQSQLPFLRQKLMPKRDAWGEPVQNNKWFDVMPVAVTEASHDKVKTEAVRLELAISSAPKFVLERGPFKTKDRRIDLTAEQRDVFAETMGKNAMTLLSPIVNAPDWERIPDFAKAEIYKRVLEGTRKQGQYAALPPADAERIKMREEIVGKVLKQVEESQGK